MLKEIEDVVARSKATLLKDVIGAVALLFTLVAGLHLPGVFLP